MVRPPTRGGEEEGEDLCNRGVFGERPNSFPVRRHVQLRRRQTLCMNQSPSASTTAWAAMTILSSPSQLTACLHVFHASSSGRRAARARKVHALIHSHPASSSKAEVHAMPFPPLRHM
ncbi:uncharacterized protein MCYG_06239 [Microsporum canis CBS 113480]|uniref:Uncharacterized protein n=1 Tax=Arthroderma otae (strain ATCC MYA-4605 / CBS 113480) TaxID=554155 RepID=C5FU36_ARTOC|nr:uncharacterized protein MCYG_06239 [Microsporum canis CBS 113480]EEQ33420.1 predicted protein [Microsporum canis CBS 113480]